MIMLSQLAHAMLVYYNLKMSRAEGKFPEVLVTALQAHYTQQNVRPELQTFS